MANVEHNVLTDPELHEPKGFAAAADNEVYVADGSASGAFAQITPTNRVMVHSASDFPAASSSVRTLAASTVYQVVGTVDISGDRLVMGADTLLYGLNPTIDNLVTTNSGAMITSAVSCRLEGLGFTCSSGDWLSFSGGGTKNLVITNCKVTSCSTLGTVTAAALFSLTMTTVVACTVKGLTFTGTGGHLHIQGGDYDSSAGSVFDLGTSVWTTIRLLFIQVNNPSGITGIDIAASSANLASGGLGYLINNFIESPATATVGYAVGDIQWIVKGNLGIPNNIAKASGSVTDSAQGTTISDVGDGNDVLVNVSTNYTADISDKFTQTTAGAVKYVGLEPVTLDVTVTIYASSAAAKEYNFYIAKNGTLIASSISQIIYDGTLDLPCVCHSLVDVVTDDIITLRVRQETATPATITIDTMSFKISEL